MHSSYAFPDVPIYVCVCVYIYIHVCTSTDTDVDMDKPNGTCFVICWLIFQFFSTFGIDWNRHVLLKSTQKQSRIQWEGFAMDCGFNHPLYIKNGYKYLYVYEHVYMYSKNGY